MSCNMSWIRKRIVTMKSFYIFFFVLLLPPFNARGQDDPPRPVLPDIAPRVVEIRGQLEIELPSLRRQPLVGFNPPPRVAPIPPERRPYVEAYKQTNAELPPSPLDPPQPPDVSGLSERIPRSGEVEASAGRYLSRLLRVRAEMPMGHAGSGYAKLDYKGTDGHRPFKNLEELQSSYDALKAVAGLQITRAFVSAGVEFDGFSNRYRLYAAEPGPSYSGRKMNPRREGIGGGTSLWLRSVGEAPVEGQLRVRYGGTHYQTSALVDLLPSDPRFERGESRFDVDGQLRYALAQQRAISLDAKFSTAGLNADQTPTSRITFFDGSGGLRFKYGRNIDGYVGLRIINYLSEVQHAGALYEGDGDGLYVAPDFIVNVYPMRNVNLFIKNRPGTQTNTLTDLYNTNPYLVDQPIIQPSVTTVNIEGGGIFYQGPFEVDVKAGYQNAPNFLFFEHAIESESGGYSRGFTSARYAAAEVFHFDANVSLALPVGLNITGGVTIRDGKLKEDDADIPYFAPVLARAMLSYAFDRRRGLIQLTNTFEGARFRDRAKTRKVGDFFDLDIEASYNVTTDIGLVFRLENLSNGYLERWDYYESPPFVFIAGFRLLW